MEIWNYKQLLHQLPPPQTPPKKKKKKNPTFNKKFLKTFPKN